MRRNCLYFNAALKLFLPIFVNLIIKKTWGKEMGKRKVLHYIMIYIAQSTKRCTRTILM